MEPESEMSTHPGQEATSPEAPSPTQPTVSAESNAPALRSYSSTGKRTKPPTRRELKENQELRYTATFDISRLQHFLKQKTFHEESKTLCAYTSTDNQPKNRQAEGVKIQTGNAFQAMGTPDLKKDLTLPRFERHVSWGTVKDPSSWISVFNHLYWAVRRARFHTYESAKIGHRIAIAGISTKGLVAATAHGRYTTTYDLTTHNGVGHPNGKETYIEAHNVAIPVWVRDSAVPEDRSPITRSELEASGADLWVSITELRNSDFSKLSADTGLFEEILKKGHNYEWLCLGSIKKAHVTCVMPWDGKVLHSRQTTRIVWSRSSPQKYVFDWKQRQWRLDPKKYALAVFRDRKSELEASHRQRRRVFSKLKKRATKSTHKGVSNSSKIKRKPVLDENGIDIREPSSKILRTNADVWDLMIAAQKSDCHCKESRHTRAGSAHL